MGGTINQWLYLAVSCISLIGALVWKSYGFIQKISFLEQRVNALETDSNSSKKDLQRLEDQLFSKLIAIDQKLDKFIFDVLSRYASH